MINEELYKLFFESLISGRKIVCKKIIENLTNNNCSIIDIYENLLKKALYDVGFMWEDNKISVSVEHLSSAIVESLINDLYAHFIYEKKGKKTILLACVEDEFHQIGIKMISDIFEMHGWNTFFLGADTPIDSLIEYSNELQPDIIALSMSLYFHMPHLEKMIKTFRDNFTDTTIIVGGQGFTHGGISIIKKYFNVLYFDGLNSVEKFIIKIGDENGY